MSVALLSFEDEAPRGTGEADATTKIARALDACGIDAPASLYDEALALARDGRLAPASERLRMLLCLDPNDGEAALLLGKVLAAREQWQEALSWLDAAAANGAVLPPGVRDSVEEGLRRHVQDAEDYRSRVAARERGEIRNLRNEAKRLRSENIALEAENETLRSRVRTWSGITAVVAGSASALLLAALLFGGSDSAATDATAEVEAEVAAALAEPGPAFTVEPASAAGGATVSTPVTASAPAGAATVSVPVDKPFAASAPPAGPTTAAATPKAEATTTAKSAAPTGALLTTHTVKKGENLGAIAKKYYGSSGEWPRIQAANSDVLGGGNALQVGMKLKIPK